MEIIRKHVVKKTGYCRTGIKANHIESITVHNTGNASRGANADAHQRYLQNLENSGGTYLGYHYVVDDTQVIECLPLDEVSYHCGVPKGNYSSISIEICENSDGNYEKAEANAIKLIRKLLIEYGPILITSHYNWSGKNCPHKILPRWNEFLLEIDKEIGEILPTVVETAPSGLIRYGNKNEKVRWLQNKLLQKGYGLPRYGVDGHFGSETLSAVKSFQRDNGLVVDGIVGDKTKSKLIGV